MNIGDIKYIAYIDDVNELEDKLDEELSSIISEMENIIKNTPNVFHDAPQSSITEGMAPSDFDYGLTLCGHGDVSNFPSIDDYGVSLTLRGKNISYAQIFITRHGDIWSRRSSIIDEWNGEWYNAKKHIDRLSVNLSNIEKVLENKVDNNIIGDLSNLETSDKTSIVNAINELTNKSDLAIQNVDPTPKDKAYNIGQMWFNKRSGDLFILKGIDVEYQTAIWSKFQKSDEISYKPDDLSGSPGSSTIEIGDKSEGYYGVVDSSDFITGVDLAKSVGLTNGNAQNSNTPWHKFSFKGKTLFIPQKTIRNNISWDMLAENNLIYGNKKIKIDDVTYRVRLIKGALTDPSDYYGSDRGAKGSEWNRLIAPLNAGIKDDSWDKPERIETDLQDWKTYINDKDMTVRDASGSTTICQEVSGENSQRRVVRGDSGVSGAFSRDASDVQTDHGWRPVLEVDDGTDDDTSGSPGNSNLIKGTRTTGYFGRIDEEELITSKDLLLKLGIDTNPSRLYNEYYHKFMIDGKIMFVPQQATFLSDTNATDIHKRFSKGETLNINGINYKVRLIRGSTENPSDQNGSVLHNSEYNRTVLGLSEKNKIGWDTQSNVGKQTIDWGTHLRDIDLGYSEDNRTLVAEQLKTNNEPMTRELDINEFTRADYSNVKLILEVLN